MQGSAPAGRPLFVFSHFIIASISKSWDPRQERVNRRQANGQTPHLN